MRKNIPKHLKVFIVDQDYDNYTYVDQACWKFIMKISIDFFKKNADEIYLKGLQKTGITINKIPRIQSINSKLSKFGWNAVCVRGFIPPQAFMEFQSLKILPIAADMRNHKNLTYTPSPDIVHEASGHAPIIANKDYSNYLINYGEIAAKAILSSEDINLYHAIRNLSDIKENINSTYYRISKANKKLKDAYNNISYVSESSLLSRMNWWTVEYGLVGSVKNPKIYGAGLLSSVAESENCLNKNIKKIPFSLKCTNYTYDITEQQPQLFVTPNYKFLTKELKKLSKEMAYKRGGIDGLNTAIKAKTVCTIEIDNLIQISGIVSNYINSNKNINFIKLIGPSQISINNKQIGLHGPKYHFHGYSSPLGNLSKYKKPIHKLNKNEVNEAKIKEGNIIFLMFENEIVLNGYIKNILKMNSRIILITFTKCTLKYKKQILFEPSWGNYDLICGAKINSVYGGPADSNNYYEQIGNEKYNLKKNQQQKYKTLNRFFKKIHDLKKTKNNELELFKLYTKMKKDRINDWLLKYEFLEATNCNRKLPWINKIFIDLKRQSVNKNDLSRAIKRGINIFV